MDSQKIYKAHPLVHALKPLFSLVSQLMSWFLILVRFKRSVLIVHQKCFPWIFPRFGRLFQSLSRDFLVFFSGCNPYPVYIDHYSQQVLQRMRQGGLLLTAHLSNFELLGHLLYLQGIPLVASHRPLNSTFWQKILLRLRNRWGGYAPFPPPTTLDAIQLLRKGKVFALLADQHSHHQKARFGKLLGVNLSCQPLPDLLFQRTKCQVFLAWLEFYDNSYHLFVKNISPFGPSAINQTLMERFNDWLSAQIQLYPSQWYGWLHRRWKANRQFY